MLIPTVRPVHNWCRKKNKKSVYPIHLEIKIGKRKYYQIKVPQKVSQSDWSGCDDSWVKQSHPFFFEINNKIREKKNVVIELIKRYYTFNRSLSFDIVSKNSTGYTTPPASTHISRNTLIIQLIRLSCPEKDV